MIITAIKEGLGNQLFQYFFAKGFVNHEHRFDTSFYLTSKRTLDLKNFPRIKVVENVLSEIEAFYVKDNYRYIGDWDLPENQDYYFDGYWQNKKYLFKVESKIKEELVPTEYEKGILYTKYPFLQEECVSLHVRRSDYLNLPNHYYTLDKEYYQNAIDLVGRDKKIVVFSDDIDWCKANFGNVEYISAPSHIDLYAMSLCSHNIIANSTFSFWGAFLNQNKNKKVVAPKNWFKKDYSLLISDFKNEDCSSDLILENWKRI